MKTKQLKTKTRTKAGRTALLRCDAIVRPSAVARAIAWYRQTLPYHDACDPSTLGKTEPRKYLTNRIEAAYLEGVATGERIAAERVADHIKLIAVGRELPLMPLA